jgi:disulfide oxidoreductase YuzD
MRSIRVIQGILVCSFSGLLHAQVNVTTYHNDAFRTGQNIQETILTPANVNSTQFGKLFSVGVDGTVYAQPLYLSAVNIAGGTHNVLYVVTEHDSVYAIDADVGAVYGKVSLIPTGGTTASSTSDLDCTDLVPEVGITGTPVIDLAGGTLYVVAKSKVSGSIVQYLHALDVTTLAEKFNGPVAIQATVPGTGTDSSGGSVTFNPRQENQRAALLLENGHVIIGWGSHCDHGPWHGWVMSYNASTLTQEAAFNTSPNDGANGVWMSGGGPASDANGNIYFATGNGSWNGSSDYGDSVVKLGPPANNTFPVLDYFTPYNQGSLDSGDVDLGAGGLVLLPALPSGQQLLALQGKQGTIYLLNANNLGKYCMSLTPACTNSDPQIVQEIKGASPGIWGSPAYWNGNLYWTGANDPIKAYSFNANNSGLISTTPTSKSAQLFPFSAPTPAISSNGNSNAILWALDGSADDSTCSGGGGGNCLGLYAYDATNLANLLYSSSQAANNRDAPGNAVKFEKPIIANGKVYVATQTAVSVYGLFAALPPAPGPVFSPAPGSYSSAQTVTLSDSASGAAIYYTTNGTLPTTSSALYSPGSPLYIGYTETVEAIAVASGYSNSAVTGGTYTITSQGTTPISINLSAVDTVTGIATTGSAVPHGGLDTEGYAYAASLLGTSLSWNGSTFAFGAPETPDAVSGATIALPAGTDSTVTLLATAVNGNQPNQTFIVNYTDGTSSSFMQSVSDWFTPQKYAGESQVLKMAYRIGPTGAIDNSTVYLYGYAFAVNSAKTVKSLTLPNNRHIVVLAVDVTPATAGPPPPPPAATPTLSPSPGTYTSTQSVTLTDTTPGALIYYTTNGTTPATSSTLYSPGTPLQVAATTTIEAIAVASGYGTSAVTSGTYTISSSGGTTPISVDLSAVDTITGIANTGSPVPNGGLDTEGYAYAAALLGTSLSWNGSTFTLGAAQSSDAVSGGTIVLPAGNDSTLNLLAAAVNGNQPNQTFTVSYTDGTSSSFTQSVSDWFTPTNYSGESQALKMAYRIGPTGATSNGPVYLYGYSFALNSAKTVKSLTLPNNRHIVVLGVDVTPATAGPPPPPPATAPTLSPSPGTYTSTQSVTLTDTTPGALIYYTTSGTTPSTSSSLYSPGTPLQISATTTVEAIAVASGYGNSTVTIGTYTISSPGTPISVNLSAVDTITGIANTGSPVPNGGLDTEGYAYAAALLGTSLSWNGSTFTLGAAGSADAVSGGTIALPAANASTVNVLATAVNGHQLNQPFVVTYTDGTSSSFTQSLSDWFVPQNYTGESQASKMASRIAPSGATSSGPVYLYGYSFATNSGKTVKNLTLPNNRNVVVLAIDLVP